MRRSALLLLCLLGPAWCRVLPQDESFLRHRRDAGELDSWLTEEQKSILKPLKPSTKEFKDKVIEFFDQLPAHQRKEWTAKYKDQCFSWTSKVASADEQKELDGLYEAKEFDKAEAKVEELSKRLDEEKRKAFDLWKNDCVELKRRGDSRRRRDIDYSWLTDPQKAELDELKADDDKSYDDIVEKTYSFFDALPDEKRKEVGDAVRNNCKDFFMPLMSQDELANVKKAHEAGDKAAAKDIIEDVVDRQEGDKKAAAEKLYKVCTAFYRSGKPRRDVSEKISKHLGWLSDAQKAEIKQMTESGEDKKKIREKLFEFIKDYESDPSKKEQLKSKIQACYAWMEKVATKDEVSDLHKMHETDHEGCKKKVREFIKRLPQDEQEDVTENLPYCEKLWYGSHDHSSHSDHSAHVGHVHRRRRHLNVIDTYLDWLTPSQKRELEAMDEANFDHIINRIKEFFRDLPEERRSELKEDFKGKCALWAREVAKPAEWEQLKKLHEAGDSPAIIKILSDLESRLTENQKHTIEHVRPLCYKLWDIETPPEIYHVKPETPVIRKRRDHHPATLETALTEYLTWLSPEQVQKLKDMKEAGNKDEIYKQIMVYFDEATGDVKTKAKEGLQKACRSFSKDIFGEEKTKEMKAMKESGASVEDIAKMVDGFVASLDDAAKKEKALKLVDGCKKIYTPSRRRRDHHHTTLETALTEYLTWLSPEQVQKLKDLKEAGNKDEIYKQIMTYFEEATGDVKTKAKEGLQKACKSFAKDIFGEEKTKEIKALKESGASIEDIAKKVDEFVASIDDATKKEKALKLVDGCKKIYTPSRRRRDHHHTTLETALTEYLTWLSPEQVQKLKDLKEAGNKDEIYKQIMTYFEEATGDVKTKAKEGLQKACKSYAKDIFGEEKTKEIKALKESGASVEEMTKKIDEFVAAIDDATKKEKALKLVDGCKKVYTPSRARRDHHLATLETALTEYLTWLSPEQVQKLKDLKEAGNKDEIYKQIMVYFDEATGDVKTKAKEGLQKACKSFSKDIFGEEKTKEIKAMKESGASVEEIVKKIDGFVASIDDEAKKEKALKLVAGCKKIYTPSRMRRDHHLATLETALTEYLTWLTPEQVQKLKTLKEEGNKEEIYKQIMVFYEETSGDAREKAKESLQKACKSFAKDIFGEDKTKEIKALKESGASPDDITKKVEGFISALDDEAKKEKAQKLVAGCRKIYLPSRHRRDHHHSTLENALTKYLTWLAPSQVQTLKDLKEAGSKDEIYKQIMIFYDAAEGETKTKAKEELKNACRDFTKEILGEDAAKQLKALKEGGATAEELTKKVNELVEALDDPAKKEKAKKLSAGCQKVYTSSRRRRDHHLATLETALTEYLTWLTPEQVQKLKDLKEAGNKDEIYKQIMVYFDEATGDVKTKAKEGLQKACKSFSKDIFGEEKTKEIKAMKESGASVEEIAKKIDGFVASIDDAAKKEKALKLVDGCKKIYTPSRRRRDHHHTTLETALTEYLTWLSPEQVQKLKDLKEAGNKDEIYKQIMTYFEEATGDVKTKAKEGLQKACKSYAKDIFGEEKTKEIKAMKESGASVEEMTKKIDEFVAAIDDATKKEKALKLVDGCKKVYTPSRARRDHHLATLETALTEYLTWLSPEQVQKLKDLKEAGNKDEIYKQIMVYFDEATGDVKTKAKEGLQKACKSFSKDIFGEEKTKEIKALKESGASVEEIAKKIDEFVASIDDATKKEKALKLVDGCKKIYTPSRRRRDHHHTTLETALTEYLTWLSPEQVQKLKDLKEAGNKDEIYKQIMTYFEEATGDVKEKAKDGLQKACKSYAKDIFGEEKTKEIKALKESGASVEEIVKKIDEFVASIDDATKKEKALKLVDGCKKVYAPSRVRRDHHHTKLETALTEYLNWLSPEQVQNLKDLKEAGNKDEIYKKIMVYFDEATGDVKVNAKEGLQKACRTIGKEVFGEEKVEEIKAMRSKGATKEELLAKAGELVAAIDDPVQKTRAQVLVSGCPKVFGMARHRRSHEHSLDEALKNYLTWLSPEQVDELKKTFAEGKRDETYAKVMSFYETATGETKKTANTQLMDGCRHFIGEAIGAENADVIKKMKADGVSYEEIGKKVDEFISQISDEAKKSKTTKTAAECKKVFKNARSRRSVIPNGIYHARTNLVGSFLKHADRWLTPEQLSKIQPLRTNRDQALIVKQVLIYLSETPTKERADAAIEDISRQCARIYKQVYGDDVLVPTFARGIEQYHLDVAGLFERMPFKEYRVARKFCHAVAGLESMKTFKGWDDEDDE